jgi:hypothetical protein
MVLSISLTLRSSSGAQTPKGGSGLSLNYHQNEDNALTPNQARVCIEIGQQRHYSFRKERERGEGVNGGGVGVMGFSYH